jgi:hypothetical protein
MTGGATSRIRVLGIVTAVGAAAVGMSPVLPVDADEPPVNQVIVWDSHAYAELIAEAKQPPPTSVLHLAMVHGAMYDAVNSITDEHQPYLADHTADSTASVDAAAATAAHDVLVALLPARAGQLAALHQQSLDAIPDGSAEDGGIAVGAAAADAMLRARTNDGRTGGNPLFSVGTDPGEWRAAPAGNNFAWVAGVEPFVIQQASDFATPGPLPLASPAYAAELDEVKRLGSKTSAERTADQTQMAMFWSDHTTAIWSRILRQIASAQQLPTEASARYFASAYMSGSDAVIACFDDKERHRFWRPMTAIHEAASDGNPATTADPGWEPLIPNPPYPDHPSGANCLTSGIVHAARDFLGTNRVSFDATHSTLGITRQFTHLSHALQEMRLARMYSGLHFMTADSAGVDLGRSVGKWVAGNAFRSV